MFRELRRKQQALTHEEAEAILRDGESGVLAVWGDDDYPYAVPLNYVYAENKIYFHCAREGHKLDAIRRHEKVSFCVVAEEKIVPAALTTLFRSVIVFGRARVLETQDEVFRAAQLLGMKYYPRPEKVQEEIEKSLSRLACVEIAIEHLSGKEAIELSRERREK